MADGRKNNGGHKNSGRKPKADEQQLIEKLTPLQNKGYKALEDGLTDGQSWAVKLFFEYMYGKPKQQIEQTSIVLDTHMTEEEKANFKKDFLKDY